MFTNETILWLVVAAGVVAAIYGYLETQAITKASAGSDRMKEIAAAIQEGARAYLNLFTDDFALWALPGARIGQYAERIHVLAKANQILTQFHTLRRTDVEAGQSPTVKQSLARLQKSGR